MRFISLIVASAPPQTIRHQILQVGGPAKRARRTPVTHLPILTRVGPVVHPVAVSLSCPLLLCLPLLLPSSPPRAGVEEISEDDPRSRWVGSRVFLHVHSAELLPSLGPGPPGLAALVLCMGYKSVTSGARGLSPPENVFLLLFPVVTCRPSRPFIPVCGSHCMSPDTALR